MRELDFSLARVWCKEIGNRLGGGPSPARPSGVRSGVDRDSLTRREAERNAVRNIIDGCLGTGVEVMHDADGAPYVWWPRSQSTPDIHISISHSRRLAVVAVSESARVGVDAEEWRPALAKVAERFLSAQERRMFTRDEQLLAAWTIKEAVYKAAGREAYEFAEAIAIAEDMRTARVGIKKYVIETHRVDDTVISLAAVL